MEESAEGMGDFGARHSPVPSDPHVKLIRPEAVRSSFSMSVGKSVDKDASSGLVGDDIFSNAPVRDRDEVRKRFEALYRASPLPQIFRQRMTPLDSLLGSASAEHGIQKPSSPSKDSTSTTTGGFVTPKQTRRTESEPPSLPNSDRRTNETPRQGRSRARSPRTPRTPSRGTPLGKGRELTVLGTPKKDVVLSPVLETALDSCSRTFRGRVIKPPLQHWRCQSLQYDQYGNVLGIHSNEGTDSPLKAVEIVHKTAKKRRSGAAISAQRSKGMKDVEPVTLDDVPEKESPKKGRGEGRRDSDKPKRKYKKRSVASVPSVGGGQGEAARADKSQPLKRRRLRKVDAVSSPAGSAESGKPRSSRRKRLRKADIDDATVVEDSQASEAPRRRTKRKREGGDTSRKRRTRTSDDGDYVPVDWSKKKRRGRDARPWSDEEHLRLFVASEDPKLDPSKPSFWQNVAYRVNHGRSASRARTAGECKHEFQRKYHAPLPAERLEKNRGSAHSSSLMERFGRVGLDRNGDDDGAVIQHPSLLHTAQFLLPSSARRASDLLDANPLSRSFSGSREKGTRDAHHSLHHEDSNEDIHDLSGEEDYEFTGAISANAFDDLDDDVFGFSP